MTIQLFPQTSDRTPWGTALLSLAPFFITGPGAILLSYHPWWDPGRWSWVAPLFVIVAVLSIAIGLVLGVLRKFPRWSYPYAVYGVILLTFLATYWINRTPWDINHESLILFLVVGLSILITWSVPITRPFYTNLRRDWTPLSYGLYACTLFLFATQDQDESPTLTLLVLLPSLIALLGALAHLRLASAVQRFAVLLLSMLLGAFIWTLPVFGGMMGSRESFLQALGMLLTIWGILAALILAPILVGVFNRPGQRVMT